MENTLNMELAPTKVHAWHPQQACGKCHFCIRDWARRSVYVNLSMNVDAAPASARVTNVQRVAICALFSNRLIPLWTFIPLVQTCYTSLGFFFFPEFKCGTYFVTMKTHNHFVIAASDQGISKSSFHNLADYKLQLASFYKLLDVHRWLEKIIPLSVCVYVLYARW